MKKVLAVLSVPALLALFSAVAMTMGGAAEDTTTNFAGSEETFVIGTMQGSNNCIIHFTLSASYVDDVKAIDCPPEGLPDEAAGKATLREQAIALFPEYEASIASMKDIR